MLDQDARTEVAPEPAGPESPKRGRRSTLFVVLVVIAAVAIAAAGLASGDAPPGFPGPNDHWHLHQNLCIKYGAAGISVPFAPDRDVTRAQCNTVHGQFMRKTVWMVHAWVVPGWESPNGVFSHANDNL